MNLDAAEQARVLRLLQLVKISAEEAIKGLTFGLLHAENAQQPRVLVAANQPDPRVVAQQAAQGALQSFAVHANQVVMFAAQIPPKAAAGATDPDDDEPNPASQNGTHGPRLAMD